MISIQTSIRKSTNLSSKGSRKEKKSAKDKMKSESTLMIRKSIRKEISRTMMVRATIAKIIAQDILIDNDLETTKDKTSDGIFTKKYNRLTILTLFLKNSVNFQFSRKKTKFLKKSLKIKWSWSLETQDVVNQRKFQD